MEPQAQLFTYRTPAVTSGKSFVRLCQTPHLGASVQVVAQGGENNLHFHRYQDGFFMVLAGRARFYGEHDKLIADLGPNEGILIPHDFKYWFESAGEHTLELIQVEAATRPLSQPESDAQRIDAAPRKSSFEAAQFFDAGRSAGTGSGAANLK
jgi:mannose-6-phosphate isomerase-like protein (cupin superfamily)